MEVYNLQKLQVTVVSGLLLNAGERISLPFYFSIDLHQSYLPFTFQMLKTTS